MGMKPPPLTSIIAAIVFALSVFGFTLFVWVSFGGTVPLQAKGYEFHAHFGSDAINLTHGSQVRMAGVKVGKVVKVVEEGGGLDATMQLESRFAPIARDARAVLRVKTLLGEAFVELTPGTPNSPTVKEGGSLPLGAVEPSQTLDQVLSAFDKPTRDDLKKFLGDLATALKGRGDDVNAALGNAGPTVDNLATIVDVLDRQSADVRRLVRNSGTTLQAIANRSGAVQSLISSGDQVFAATAARNRAVTGTVQGLPPFLRELRATLASLETTAAAAGPTLHVLRPVAPLVKPALNGVNRLAPQLTRLARGLSPVIDSSVKGLPAATKLTDNLRPLLDIIDPVGSGLAPLLSLLLPAIDYLDQFKQEALTQFSNASSVSEGSFPLPDGSRWHYGRVLPPINNESFVGYAQRPGTNRHNAYLGPGGLADMATNSVKSFDCKNAGNATPVPALSSSPPCQAQGTIAGRNGESLHYPHLTKK